MENQVEEIKRKLDIVNVISRFIPLKKRGRHFVANCPFHQEKTPSFIVSPELQIFKCFGCGQAGDIYTFVQLFEKVDFPEALQILAQMAGVVLKKTPQLAQAASQKNQLLALNHQICRFYHYILTSHSLGKSALNYLLGRGIKSSTITVFQLGFAPLNSQLLVNFLLKKGFSPSQLLASGVISSSQYQKNKLYDRFSGRLIIPFFDHRQHCLGFSGRILPGSKANQAKYINSPDSPLYHKSHLLFGLNLAKDYIRQQGRAIVVEGHFDMISPFQAGIRNIVALQGTAFTSEQLRLLTRFTDSLVLALDTDFAGSSAALRSIKLADDFDFDIQVLDLGNYKDPDEAVQKDPQFFKNQLQHTLSIWDFIISSALKTYSPETVKGKKAILSTVLPFISQINNSVIRADYLKKLAQTINSDPQALLQESQKYSSSAPMPAPPSTLPQTNPQEKLEENLLVLLFSSPRPLYLLKKIKKYFHLVATPRFQHLLKFLSSVKKFNPQKFLQSLPAELQPLFQTIFLKGQEANFDSRHRLLQLQKTLNQLHTLTLKDQLNQLSQQISRLESQKPSPNLTRLERQYNQILKKLKNPLNLKI